MKSEKSSTPDKSSEMNGGESLPVSRLYPEIRGLWEQTRRYVIQAEPGAGKSTGIPAFLLDSGLCAGRIIMLEPRRMAARSLARFLASRRGEEPGGTVGFRVRGESRCGRQTRLEIVTEGVFVRMIQNDPELPGVDAVILDEFHERNLFSDLSFALALDVQENLRPDLTLLVMSATPEKEMLEKSLTGAAFLESRGRMFPVETVFDRDQRDWRPDSRRICRAVRRGLEETDGDVLVFLPGEREIRDLAAACREAGLNGDADFLPLYSRLPLKEQDRALRPGGRRKIVAATSIAETSLTIPGVTAVVDTGLERRPVFDRHSGLTRLETAPVSRASAEQRKGRAGRVRAGLCLRLWTEGEHRQMDGFREPEIRNSDLSSLVLELLLWGCGTPDGLSWPETPPAAHYYQARQLLVLLGAVDGENRLTPRGRRMAGMGLEPRLAHLVLEGRERGDEQTACCLAALLSERDWMGSGAGSDLASRLYALKNGRDRGHPAVRNIMRTWEALLGKGKPELRALEPEKTAELLCQACPDRIGRRRGDRVYQLSGGGSCRVRETDSLQNYEYILAAQTGGAGEVPLVFLGAGLDRSLITEEFESVLVTRERVSWDEQKNRLKSRRTVQLGHLILREDPLPEPSSDASLEDLAELLKKKGLSCLPWRKEDSAFLERCRFISSLPGKHRPAGWPDYSESALIGSLDLWFRPLLIRGRLESSLKSGLLSLLPWDLQTRLEKLAPERWQVPSGSRLRIDYSDPAAPSLEARIQELFGLTATPLLGGSVPLTMKLLNPARRPIQVTRDLESFWKNTYGEVRKELRGRYPKHYWPENPFEAEPTSRVRPRQS